MYHLPTNTIFQVNSTGIRWQLSHRDKKDSGENEGCDLNFFKSSRAFLDKEYSPLLLDS